MRKAGITATTHQVSAGHPVLSELAPGERSASTSNRNFEGRQGKGGRTHLVSPLVAAATAVTGTLASPADLPPLSPSTGSGTERD